MLTLLPRIDKQSARILLEDFLNQSWSREYTALQRMPEDTRFASTGGVSINVLQVNNMRHDIWRLAKAHGFPDHRPNRTFDWILAEWLHSLDLLASPDALRDDVWSFFGCVVAPQIVHWRFGQSVERYVGGVRNCFQRLFLRAKCFDRGEGHSERWALLRSISEDACVQILERPSISADRRLALSVGESWLRFACDNRAGRVEETTRRVMLILRIKLQLYDVCMYEDGELREFLDSLFAECGSLVRGNK